ncbi:MAG TPA: chemotaxis protein CheB [Terriglobales bacterium]|nr:chemotaxis protein CheB [Terriglobales bacterium]
MAIHTNVISVHFPVVCLAGSAGGLEAYREILRHLPNDNGITFVIVSHRGEGDPTLLPSLLARVTRMEVLEAEDGMMLEPNCVFVKPARTHLTTDGLAFQLYDQPGAPGWSVDVTCFLLSLAKTCSSRSIAVILSGMGFDGSSALGNIKQAGGVVFAQSDPVYGDMPNPLSTPATWISRSQPRKLASAWQQ